MRKATRYCAQCKEMRYATDFLDIFSCVCEDCITAKRCHWCGAKKPERLFRKANMTVCSECEAKAHEHQKALRKAKLINCYKCGCEMKPKQAASYLEIFKHSLGDNKELSYGWYGFVVMDGWNHVPVCHKCDIEIKIEDARKEEVLRKIREYKSEENKAYKKRCVDELRPTYVKGLLRRQGIPGEHLTKHPELVEITQIHLKTKRELKKLKS